VAAGAGNNGGDGWVAARALHAAAVPVWVAALDPKTDDAIDNRALARVDGVREIGREEPWPAAAVAVDALLGTGAAGPARGDVLALAQRLVTYGAPIVAIDGPTGLDLSTGEAHGPLRADVSVTFGGPRRGHLLARDWCGKVVVVDIGFPPPDPGWPVLVTDAWAGARLPKLAPTMHKGDRGRVTVVGGSNGMTGAALHAARAALTLFQGPIERPVVLTPPLGEFRAQFGDQLADEAANDRWAAATKAAQKVKATVLLKGVPTVIADLRGPIHVVASGNPGLATGGSGDLLAGFIGAFLARGSPGPEAAALGAHALGRAA